MPEAADSAVLRSGTLSFQAHATVGDFVGTTSDVSGAISGAIPHVRGWVEAKPATLDTRNNLRDRDLRKSMEVERFPTMRFELSDVTVLSAPTHAGDTAAVLLHGTLTVHGVTRQVDVRATLARSSDTTRVTAAFPLNMEDYQIRGLRKAMGLLRVQPVIEVRVDLRFVTIATATPPDIHRQLSLSPP